MKGIKAQIHVWLLIHARDEANLQPEHKSLYNIILFSSVCFVCLIVFNFRLCYLMSTFLCFSFFCFFLLNVVSWALLPVNCLSKDLLPLWLPGRHPSLILGQTLRFHISSSQVGILWKLCFLVEESEGYLGNLIWSRYSRIQTYRVQTVPVAEGNPCDGYCPLEMPVVPEALTSPACRWGLVCLFLLFSCCY